MDYYWKTIALILIGVILWIVVEKQEKNISVLITIALCCMAASCAASYLKPVIRFLWELNVMGKNDDTVLKYLLTAVGIGFVSEITGRICADTGNTSVGSVVKFLGSSAMLYSGMPVMQSLVLLIQEIIGVI